MLESWGVLNLYHTIWCIELVETLFVNNLIALVLKKLKKIYPTDEYVFILPFLLLVRIGWLEKWLKIYRPKFDPTFFPFLEFWHVLHTKNEMTTFFLIFLTTKHASVATRNTKKNVDEKSAIILEMLFLVAFIGLYHFKWINKRGGPASYEVLFI